MDVIGDDIKTLKTSRLRIKGSFGLVPAHNDWIEKEEMPWLY
jgi:hypothetical protein